MKLLKKLAQSKKIDSFDSLPNCQLEKEVPVKNIKFVGGTKLHTD
jgi:hypothetical protein